MLLNKFTKYFSNIEIQLINYRLVICLRMHILFNLKRLKRKFKILIYKINFVYIIIHYIYITYLKINFVQLIYDTTVYYS